MSYCLLLIVSRAYEGVTNYKLGQSERFKRDTRSVTELGAAVTGISHIDEVYNKYVDILHSQQCLHRCIGCTCTKHAARVT